MKGAAPIYLLLVFICGGVAAINLSGLMYGIPPHYEAAWWKVGLACLFGVVFGTQAQSQTDD